MNRRDRIHAAVLLLMPLAKDEQWVPIIAKLMDREATVSRADRVEKKRRAGKSWLKVREGLGLRDE